MPSHTHPSLQFNKSQEQPGMLHPGAISIMSLTKGCMANCLIISPLPVTSNTHVEVQPGYKKMKAKSQQWRIHELLFYVQGNGKKRGRGDDDSENSPVFMVPFKYSTCTRYTACILLILSEQYLIHPWLT